MNVFFTCSTNKIKKYARYYRAIRNEILNQGNKINRDWLDYSINLAERNIPDIPSSNYYQDVISAILTADSIVVDTTVKSMALGYQIAYALSNNKLVLLLHFKDKGVIKHFIEGSNLENLNVYEYKTEAEAKKIIKQFFKKYRNLPKKRFNLVLTGSLNNYINWASFNYQKTKTELIHKAIEKMLENDSLYKKYLLKEN